MNDEAPGIAPDTATVELFKQEPPRSLLLARRTLTGLKHIPAGLWAAWDLLFCPPAIWLALKSNPFSFNKFGPENALKMALLAGVVFVFAGLMSDLYAARNLRAWSALLPKIALCALAAGGAAFAFGYFMYFQVPGRLIILTACGYLPGIVLLPRLPFLIFRSFLRTRVLLLGSENELAHVRNLLEQAGRHAYKLVGCLPVESTENKKGRENPGLGEICRKWQVDEVVLPAINDQARRCFGRILEAVKSGCKVTLLPDLLENETKRVPLDLVDVTWLLGQGWDLRNQLVEFTKRTLDIVLSLCGLVCCLPFYPLLALAVKISSPGPIFYGQTRVGRFGTNFTIFKFRTMRTDAEAGGAQWAKERDPRTTRVGAFLRKTRLDETPQFLNILFGQMSLVGPRPERPEFVSELERQLPFYAVRHLVRPGLTGWAQISYRYGASVEDAKRKLEYDLYYVRRLGIGLDLFIILRTFTAMIKGAR